MIPQESVLLFLLLLYLHRLLHLTLHLSAMKTFTVLSAVLGFLSASSSLVTALPNWAISGFSNSNCAFSSSVYATQKDSTYYDCTGFGQTVHGVEFNGAGDWTATLFSDGNCKNQVGYLDNGVSGCTGGNFGSYIIGIPDRKARVEKA